MSLSDLDKELLPFLSRDQRPDVKFFAMQHFLGLSGTVAGREFIASKEVYIDRIVGLACDNVKNIVKDALACLVNLAGDDVTARLIINCANSGEFLDMLLSNVVEKGCLLADVLAMLLSNLTRIEEGADKVVGMLTSADPPTTMDRLVQVMCLLDYNPNADLHFLAPFLANLSQISVTRKQFLDKEGCILQRLLPFTQHENLIRRQGITSILKNVCFETDYHPWLFSPEVDIMPALLLPLAGPEEFDEDDMERLPTELQYLEPSKTREPDPLIRKNLIEALTQLCATGAGRKYMKEKNVYVIMREYHSWEKEKQIELPLMNLIDILIGDEPEPGLDTNLKKIDIPEKYQAVFEQEIKELEQGVDSIDAADK